MSRKSSKSSDPGRPSTVKQAPPTPVPPRSTSQLRDIDMAHMLLEIQQKINTSPALNGGFDTMLYKVDKIEESQGKIVQTVGLIHDAIYEPDTGIFSRIAAVKASQVEQAGEIDKKLIELNVWKVNVDKASGEAKKEDKVLEEKVSQQQKTIESLETWKKTVTSVSKWTLGALGGGTMTLLFKVAYDFITLHWK